MYNNSYEDYIRSVLGYPNLNNQNIYNDYGCSNCDANNNYNMNDLDYYNYNNYDYLNQANLDAQNRNNQSQIEECYPEIYHIVYPMVQKRCQSIDGPITKDEVEKIIEELYFNLEQNEEINIYFDSNIIEQNNRNNSFNDKIDNNKNLKDESKLKSPYVKTENRSTGLFKPNVEPKRENIEPKKEYVNKEVVNEKINNNKEVRVANIKSKEVRFCNNGLCDLIRVLLVRELIGRPGYRPRPIFPPPPPPRPPFRPGRPPFYRDLDSDFYEN